MKIRTVEPYVLEVLTTNKQSRKDDFILIECVIEKMVGITDLSFKTIMLNHKELNIPSFETITRCRRKLQETNPELVDEETEQYREEKIDEYIQYALNIGD